MTDENITVKDMKKKGPYEGLFALTDDVKINGEEIVFKRFMFGQLPTVNPLLAFLFPTLMRLPPPDTPEAESEWNTAFQEELTAIFLEEQKLEAAIELLMLATGKERAWFDEIDPTDGSVLFGKVIRLNLNLFLQTGVRKKKGSG